MAQSENAGQRIVSAATSWPGVTTETGTRGELSIKLGRRELGHLHGDRSLHLGFPRATWHELHDAGRIDYHPVFPGKPGYGSRLLHGEEDVRDAIDLLRLNYDRAVAKHGPPSDLAA